MVPCFQGQAGFWSRLPENIHLMRLLFILLVLGSINASGQSVTIWELVQVNPAFKKEALYYYEHNWKLYRDIARQKGFIQSYRLEQSITDSTGGLELMLITEYKDSIAFQQSENNFRGILTQARPDGPLLLNKIQPADFRKIILVKISSNLFRAPAAAQPPDNPGHLE